MLALLFLSNVVLGLFGGFQRSMRLKYGSLLLALRSFDRLRMTRGQNDMGGVKCAK